MADIKVAEPIENKLDALLRSAEGMDTEKPEFSKWHKAASYEYITAASGELSALSIVCIEHPENRSEWRLQSAKYRVSPEVLGLANDAWRWCGGEQDPSRAKVAIATARVEYVRSIISLALWVAAKMPIHRARKSEDVLRWREQFGHLGLLAPEALFLAPYAPPFEDESRSFTMSDWTYNYDHAAEKHEFLKHPPADVAKEWLTRDAVMAAAALAWLDGAIAAPDAFTQLDLMACAGSALHQCGFTSGWDGHEEMIRSDASRAGKAGARAKYQLTDRLKEWALSQVTPQMPASMDVARMLARRIPDDLREASKDPTRLIYEALRAKSSQRGTPGG